MQVGLTSGCFDLVHHGHLVYLERCRAACDKLLVGVDSDAMVRAFKGPERPIIPELERLAMVQSLVPVDAAFLMHDLQDLETIVRQFKVRYMFKHEGFLKLEGAGPFYKHPDVVGCGPPDLAALCIIPDVPGLVSTSEIIARILAGGHKTG